MTMRKAMSEDLFEKEAARRKAEQKAIENAIKKEEDGEGNIITLSIRIEENKKQKLKEYAVLHKTTITRLISDFVDELTN